MKVTNPPKQKTRFNLTATQIGARRLHILGGGRRLRTLGGARIIRLLRVRSADTLPFLFHAKIGASLPDPAVQDDVVHVQCEE